MYKSISFSSIQILSLSYVMLVSWSGSYPLFCDSQKWRREM